MVIFKRCIASKDRTFCLQKVCYCQCCLSVGEPVTVTAAAAAAVAAATVAAATVAAAVATVAAAAVAAIAPDTAATAPATADAGATVNICWRCSCLAPTS